MLQSPSTSKDSATGGALADLRVLDLTQYIAGPFCTKLLADYGAHVIKVERPGQGDGARRLGPFPGNRPHPERSGLFLHLNANKLGVTLNLRRRRGRELLRELVALSDVLVEGFSPRTLPSLGLSHRTLARWNPSLVVVSISNFGQAGPYRDYKGNELTLFAMGGPMYGRGLPQREPLKYAEHVGLYLAGLSAATAALAAVEEHATSGRGQRVDCSIQETLLSVPERLLALYSYTGDLGKRAEPHSTAYLMGSFRCKDGYVGLHGGGGDDRWWPRVYPMIGRPELAQDPRFAAPENRARHLDDFYAIWYPWLLDHTRKEVFAAARRARFPLAPVNTTQDLMEDEHLLARGLFTSVEHPEAGAFVYPGAPFRMGATPWRLRRPAPCLGQDNGAVFGHLLGHPASALERLAQQGVI